jgi:predicted PurR-regulated permease PerM
MVAVAAAFALGYVLVLLQGVLTPIFFAFLIAYMLDPVVDRFEARGLSRAMGIGVMLSIVLGSLSLFLLLAIPSVAHDVVAFAQSLPSTLASLLDRLEPTLTAYGVEVPHTLDEVLAQADLDAKELAGKAAAPATAAVTWLLGGTASLIGAMVGALMVPIFAAYLLYDFDRIVAGAGELVPPRWRDFVFTVAREADHVLGKFVRGQLLVMLALAVLYSLAYVLLGVRLAVLIGVVGGLLSFIPYVGGAVALGMGVLMSLLYWSGWGQLAGVLVAYTLIQLLESFVITPKVVGDEVGLSALWVLIALTAGGELFGFMGVLLALPTAAVLKIFIVRGLAAYRASDFFNDDAPVDPAASFARMAKMASYELEPDPDEAPSPLEEVAAAPAEPEPEPEPEPEAPAPEPEPEAPAPEPEPEPEPDTDPPPGV